MKTLVPIVVIVIALIAVVVFVNFMNTDSRNCDPIDRINSELPSYFIYTNENENIPEELLVFGPMISPDTFENDIIYKTNGWNFYCKYNNASAEKVEYFYHSKPCLEGAWYNRYAYVCGDNYFILDAKDAGGVRLYGPFDVAS